MDSPPSKPARPSVADALRAELRAEQADWTPEERVEEALRLGEEAIELYAEVHGVSHEAARRTLERNRQQGRRPSACALEP